MDRIDDQTRARIIALYSAGHETTEITRETGVGRASIYFVLREAGVVGREGTAVLETNSVDDPTTPTAVPNDLVEPHD